MILIKQHNSHQVAHLYEHLFCMAIDDFFYENKLFPYVDYGYTAKTIYGVFYFAIDLHTEKAKKLEGSIQRLKISLEKAALHAAIIQLGSEMECNLGVIGESTPNWKVVWEELLIIEGKPWRNIKDVDIIDPRTAKLVPGSIYILKNKTLLPVRKVNVTFALDKEFVDGHKDLLPLYHEIGEMMAENVRANLYRGVGFYSMGITRSPKNQALKLIHAFHISEAYPLKMSLVSESIEESLFGLYQFGAFQRLMTQLRNVSHSDPNKIFPGVNHIFEQTGLITGEKGWRRIATEDNCEMILSHMKVSIEADASSISLDIATTFKLDKQ